jgi:hypothetical protein
MIRCQDQHETTSTLSEEVLVVISKTQRRVRWMFPDGGVVIGPELVEEGAVEVDRQEDGAEDEGVEGVDRSDLASPGESSACAISDIVCGCNMYIAMVTRA